VAVKASYRVKGGDDRRLVRLVLHGRYEKDSVETTRTFCTPAFLLARWNLADLAGMSVWDVTVEEE
jgi:hypothetical protein